MKKDNDIENAVPVEFDPFAGPEITRVAPAIEPQLEIWVASQMGGEDANRSYNESVSLLLTGPFDKYSMELALQEVVNRHEALRSAISANGSQICIFKEWGVHVKYRDLSSLSDIEQQQWIADFRKGDALETFDLLNGPLFRPALFKLSDQSHYLTLSAHHIICDGWSLGILMQDISKLYSAYATKQIPFLPKAKQFSEYAVSQWEFEQSEEYKKIEQYWLDQYKDAVPELNLPVDFPRPPVRTYKSHRDDYTIDEDLVAAIKALGNQAGSSFVITLLAAFEIYLHRLTGQNDIVLGLPAAGQSATDNYSLIGHCVNLLPLKSHPQGELSFTDYLKQRKSSIFDAFDHQRFTFGSLLKKLNITRDASRVPLVPVVFNIDTGMDDGVAFEGLKHKLIYNPREYENFELFLNTSILDQQLVLEWSYNTQLFKAASIKRMMKEFEFLLREIAKDPFIKIKNIALSEPAEIYAKLNGWNNTACDYPKQSSLPDLILTKANQFPDKVAIRFGGKKITYKELNHTADQLAALLLEEYVKPGDIIALAVDRSADMLIAMIAIMKSGAAYLPIDPEYPQKRIEFMLADSNAKILLTSQKYKGRFHSEAKELTMEEVWKKLPSYKNLKKQTETQGNDLAYLLYTSGSTGNPKAVQIEHHSLVNFLLSMQKVPGIKATDRLLAITTISFDISGLELYLPLISGTELVIADAETAKDGRSLMDMILKEKISIMQATPSTWRMMLEAGWDKKIPVKALCGGEGFPKDLADKLVEKCTSVWNMYGPTETTIWSTVKQIKESDEIITIGRPIDNTSVYILDEYLRPVPEGSIGEIFIAGDGVARGYLNRAALTEEKFIDDTVSGKAGEKMYRTGDVGKFITGGEIQCLGRMDQQVKIRGYRIETGEIEQQLIKRKGIREAVVNVFEERLIAYCVLENASDLTDEQIAKWKKELQESLPVFMIPAVFMKMDKLPLTSNGKIDRKSLPHPEKNAQGGSKYFVAPRTESEKLIAGIWENLLKQNKIGLYDDFFELGGHSLIAVQAMTRLEKETGKRLPLASLLKTPTIEGLAHMLELDRKEITWDSLVPIKTEGDKMPIYIVHGFGMNVLLFNNLAKNMDDNQPVYALQAIGLNGIDDPKDKMEDIAAQYIAEILAKNNTDSYALAGYSFGGIIAFEMAQQLKAMGKEIKMLAIFDTNIDDSNYADPWATKLTKKVRRQLPKGMWVLSSLVKHPNKTIQYQTMFFRQKLHNLIDHFRKPKKANSFEERLNEKYELAYRNYKMNKYHGVIDLFRVKTRLYYLDDSIYLGWQPFSDKGVNIHEIPGDHKTFLMSPNDKDFARILQKTLDERIGVSEPVPVVKRSGFVLNEH